VTEDDRLCLFVVSGSKGGDDMILSLDFFLEKNSSPAFNEFGLYL
jgi:hypothetical protein